MHSKIFQVSATPINADNYTSPEFFYDSCSGWADYIGEPCEGDERKDCIKHLQSRFSDLFDLDETGEVLIYKGGLDEFKKEWAEAIRNAAAQINEDTVLKWSKRRDLVRACEETHLETSYRFSIEKWDTYAHAAKEFVEYIADTLKVGDKVYIGAVIDFHI